MKKILCLISLSFCLFSCQKQKSDLEILIENSCLPIGAKLERLKDELEFEEKRRDDFNVYSIKAEKLYEGEKTYLYFDDEGKCVGLLTRNPFYGFNIFGVGIYDQFYDPWYPQKDEDHGWYQLARGYDYYENVLDDAKNRKGEVWYGAFNHDETIELKFSVDFSGEEYDESMGCVRALEVIVSGQ